MKNMFLVRSNPWGKAKRDQLQSWNNLSFDPQKTDIDEQIDLVLTLGNMLKQDKQAKIKGFKLKQPQGSNKTWRSHRDVLTSREQVSCIYFVCGKYRPYLQSTNLYFRSYL